MNKKYLDKLSRKPGFLNGHRKEFGRYIQIAAAKLPSKWGNFTIFGYKDKDTNLEHTAIVKGNVESAEDCPVRVHSQCHTGDVLGSLRCDCQDQLNESLKYIGSQEKGAVIYLMQEGRGIGLINKIKAYHLQDLGLDTVDANMALGFSPDERKYPAAAAILSMLGIKSIAVLSNNPDKIKGLKNEGITITRRIPLVIEPNPHNNGYLATKRVRMGHLI